jgi:ABC-2 type transport system ATP-binding protein
MEEAYVLCDEIAIMNQGKIIAQGDPRALLKKHFQGMKFTFPQIMAKQFQGDFPWTVRSQRNRLEFLSDDVSKTIIELQKRQIDLSQMEVQTETLEDLFLDLTNEKDSRK